MQLDFEFGDIVNEDLRNEYYYYLQLATDIDWSLVEIHTDFGFECPFEANKTYQVAVVGFLIASAHQFVFSKCFEDLKAFILSLHQY